MGPANHFPVAKRSMPSSLIDSGLERKGERENESLRGAGICFLNYSIALQKGSINYTTAKCRSEWDLITGQALCLLSDQI